MLRIHLKRMHSVDDGQDTEKASLSDRMCICEHCGQSFTAFIQLEKHIQSKHMEQVRVKCKICKASLSQFSLYAHMQNIHSTRPPVKCPHCDKVSPNKAALVSMLNLLQFLVCFYQLFNGVLFINFYLHRQII